MTPYRQPTGPLVTSQTSFGTPGPCTTPYYYHFGTPTILSAESGFKSSRKRPSGKENSLKKKKKKKNTIADLSTYDKLQYFYGFLREELRWTYGELLRRWTSSTAIANNRAWNILLLISVPNPGVESISGDMRITVVSDSTCFQILPPSASTSDLVVLFTATAVRPNAFIFFS